MISPLSHLSTKEKDAINACSLGITEWVGENLAGLWLFGSKARGDDRPYSDIDLLLIVKEVSSKIQWEVYEIAADYSLEYDVLFNIHIIDRAEWEKRKRWQDTLWREVHQDGVLLTAPEMSYS